MVVNGVAAPDLVYICDWLPPDFGAVGQYALQACRSLASSGKIVVLYGLSSVEASVEMEQHGDGWLKIIRLHASVYDRNDLRARAWWTLRTNVALVRAAVMDMRRSGTILFTGSPPFLLHLLGPLNVILRKRLVYRITDFYPECLIAELGKVPALLKLISVVTHFWRMRVTHFEVLGEDQRKRLVESGIPPERILLRRDRSPAHIAPTTRPIGRPPQLNGFRTLLYSGNFGVAHDYETFLGAYRRHHRSGNGRVGLWLNAIGRNADVLERALHAARLPYARTGPVQLDKLASLLVAPDAHLITLRAAFWGYVLPSKVYGCIQSAKPILYIGPRSSDVVRLCHDAEPQVNYYHVECGDEDAAFRALENLGVA